MSLNYRLDQIHALNLQFAAVEEKLLSEIAGLRDQEEATSAKLGAARQQAAQDAGEQNRLRDETRQAGQELPALKQKLQALQEQHLQLQKELVAREQVLLEQAERAKQQLENILRTQIQREQAMAERLDGVYSQAAQESVETARGLKEQQHALHSQHTAREQALGQQLEVEKQERRQREQTLLEQTSLAKQEIENLLRTQAQREREVLTQILAVQQQSTREKAELTRHHAEKVHELGSQEAQRQKALTQQLHAHQQELRNLHKERVKRQQEAAQETADLARRHSEQEHALLRQQVDCEKTHSLQLLTQQDEFRNLHVAHSKREQALLEEHKQIRQQRNGLRDALVLREQETLAQLQAAQKQAAQEIAELLRKQNEQSEQKHDLHRQHSEREETLTQQLQGLHQTLQLRAEQHGLELSTKLEERTRLLEACAALEAQLQVEMQTGQQTSMHLRQLLKEVQHSLEMAHTSLSWRITAPLRKLVWIFALNKNQALAPISFSEPITPEQGVQIAKQLSPTIVRTISAEPTMPPLAQATFNHTKTIASTLKELLACNGHQFVDCAYKTLLGRTPDVEGQAYYLARLNTGHSKMQIVAQLHLSKEGKKRSTHLLGLETAIKYHKRSQYPLVGWFFRQIDDTEGNSSTERKLRAIENKTLLLMEVNTQRFNRLDHQLAEISNLITQKTNSMLATSAQKTDEMSILQNSLAEIHSLIGDKQARILQHLESETSNQTNQEICVKPEAIQVLNSPKQNDKLNYLTIEDLIKISSSKDKGYDIRCLASNAQHLTIENLLEISIAIG